MKRMNDRDAYLPSFTVLNSVKQGGIVSPILFEYFIYKLSVFLLKSSNIDGQVGYVMLCYGDDVCFIAM